MPASSRRKDHFPRPPAAAVARLQASEKRQRSETRRRFPDAEISPVNVEGLLLVGRCLCMCGCNQALDFESQWDTNSPPPAYPIIAHPKTRAAKGFASHTPKSVEIWRHDCNQKSAGVEWSQISVGRRMEPDHTPKSLDPDEREKREATRTIKGAGKLVGPGFRKHPSLKRGVDGRVRERT